MGVEEAEEIVTKRVLANVAKIERPRLKALRELDIVTKMMKM
jgi:hypothetical protein